MLFLKHFPAAPLDAFIDYLWFYDAAPRPFAKERMLPSPTAVLIINLAEDEVRSYSGDDLKIVNRFRGTTLTGVQSRSFVIDTREQTSVMGVEFRPGGAWPFFSPAADELSNQHTSIKDIWGDRAESLRAQLLHAPTPVAKFSILEAALLNSAARPIERDACIAHAIQALTYAPQMHTIAALGKCMSYSARKFSQMFTQQVGLKPKTFLRVQRFNQVLGQIGVGRGVDWVSVAVQCGYYDQAHFIHDFRAFSGFTPSEYVARRKMDGRHVPLD